MYIHSRMSYTYVPSRILKHVLGHVFKKLGYSFVVCLLQICDSFVVLCYNFMTHLLCVCYKFVTDLLCCVTIL